MTKPKPNNCPVCKNEAELMGPFAGRFKVCCVNPECAMEGPFEPTENVAVMAWNDIRYMVDSPDHPPTCVTCIHYEMGAAGGHFCRRVDRKVDLVTGEVTETISNAPCYDERDPDDADDPDTKACGPDGRFWTPRKDGE